MTQTTGHDQALNGLGICPRCGVCVCCTHPFPDVCEDGTSHDDVFGQHRSELVEREREHDEFVNSILEFAPEAWDQDAAAEHIALDFVGHLVDEVVRLGGRLYPWVEEPEPDHRYVCINGHREAQHGPPDLCGPLPFTAVGLNALTYECAVEGCQAEAEPVSPVLGDVDG